MAVADSSISGVVFRIRQMAPRVAIEHDARAEDPVGVGERLDPPHQLGRDVSPHSRSTNGAMFTPVPCSALSEPS